MLSLQLFAVGRCEPELVNSGATDTEERLDAGGVSTPKFLAAFDAWGAALSGRKPQSERDLDLAWPCGRWGDRWVVLSTGQTDRAWPSLAC